MLIGMETGTVTSEGDRQMVRLPKSVHLPMGTVAVRQEGDTIVLEPLKATAWPAGFFEAIHITDPAFARPAQGQLPPVRNI
jgi:virulence-associated protein VagC